MDAAEPIQTALSEIARQVGDDLQMLTGLPIHRVGISDRIAAGHVEHTDEQVAMLDWICGKVGFNVLDEHIFAAEMHSILTGVTMGSEQTLDSHVTPQDYLARLRAAAGH